VSRGIALLKHEETRKVQILNEWLAKDVAAIASSSNTNHLSSQQINKNKLGMSNRRHVNIENLLYDTTDLCTKFGGSNPHAPRLLQV